MNSNRIPDDDDIDLAELVRAVWSRKWVVIGITSVSTIIALIIALMLPNVYKAEALLAPSQNEGARGLSSLAAQYGGLASLAGLNLGGESVDKTALGLEILKSRKFISDFVERHDILVPLFAAKGWNLSTGELEIDADLYDVDAGKWVRSPSPPRGAVPSRQEAYEAFSGDVLSVIQNKKTGFVTLAVKHYSPAVAKQWVDWIVEDINAEVMQQEVEEAEQAIAYLEEQIAATPLADLQSVFFRLIEEQTKTVMLARVSPEYLFRTVDPAVEPEIKHSPKRSVIVAVGILFGGAIGLITVVFLRSRCRPLSEPID